MEGADVEGTSLASSEMIPPQTDMPLRYPSLPAKPAPSLASLSSLLGDDSTTTISIENEETHSQRRRGQPSDGRTSSSSFLLVPREIVHMWDALFFQGMSADVILHTQDGGEIIAQGSILAFHSRVLEKEVARSMKEQRHPPWHLHIRGVSSELARSFVRCLHSAQIDEEMMKRNFFQFLLLGHRYEVNLLKSLCLQKLRETEAALEKEKETEKEKRKKKKKQELGGVLSIDNCVDLFLLARFLGAHEIKAICERFIFKRFAKVQEKEAWDLLRREDEELAEGLMRKWRRQQEEAVQQSEEEERICSELHDAVIALDHICNEGCSTLNTPSSSSADQSGPDGFESSFFSSSSATPITSSCGVRACRPVERLVRHFATCPVKVSGGCPECKKMWTLLELHSRICHSDAYCRVPLCRHFKDKNGVSATSTEKNWDYFMEKVSSTRGPGSRRSQVEEDIDFSLPV